MRRIFGIGLLTLGLLGLAFGHGHRWHDQNNDEKGDPKQPTRQAPEIDPSEAASALAIVAGGLLVINRKK